MMSLWRLIYQIRWCSKTHLRAGGTKITPPQSVSDNGPLSLKKVKEHFGRPMYDQVPPKQWVLLLADSQECSEPRGTDPARRNADWGCSSKRASHMGSRTRRQFCWQPREDCLTLESAEEIPWPKCRWGLGEEGIVILLQGTCSVMRVEAGERGSLSATHKDTGSLHQQPALMR